MKPVINDKTILRMQKAVGLPISRGVDKTINHMLDQLEELKTNPETKNDEPVSETEETSECKCENDEVEQAGQKNQGENSKDE